MHDTIEIIDYDSAYRADFKRLNVAWIETHWALEAEDHRALDDPETSILAIGGHILLGRMDAAIIGTVALIPHSRGTVELAKMTVDAALRGRRIGLRLAEAAIDRARAMGAAELVLESNTILEPAIDLYRRLGFVRFDGPPSPFARCNIQMRLALCVPEVEQPLCGA